MIPSPGRDQRLTARVAPGINLGVVQGPEQSGQASAGAVANIRPKPRIAWHRRPLFSPGLDGDQLQVENLDGPGSEEWTFRESTHSQSVLDGLNTLRTEGTFCDVVIVVDGQEFPVHKSVLSAASPYFKAMFTCNLAEANLAKVPINGVESHIIRQLLDYIYSSEVTISKENVQSLLSAANLLEILPVRDACCQFLDRHMDESNCLGIQSFAEAHSCLDLQQKARSFALKHFNDLIPGEEFEAIPESQLVDLISSDELEVHREEDVFNAVIKWAECKADTCRKTRLHAVLAHVRLPLVSPYFLHDWVEKNPFVSGSPDSLHIVEEAKLFHLLPDRRPDFEHSARFTPRRNAGTAQVIVSVGGEDDKVVLRSVEYWDPCTNVWKQLAALPFAVSKHGLVVSGQNKMYMSGGEYPDGSASQAFWRFDPVLDIWQEMASMQTPRSELGLAMLDGHVFAVGGWEGSSRLDSVERYDPETNTWSPVASLKMAVTSPAVVAHEGCLYVSGGAILEDGDGIELVQRYDSKSGEWTEVAGMLIPRSGSAACLLGGYIYVIGGWHASTENTNKVERYDIQKNIWNFVSPMIERRYRPGVAVLGGKIYVLGGEEGWDHYHDTIECYDPVVNKWELVGEMGSSRSWLSCVGITVKLGSGGATGEEKS